MIEARLAITRYETVRVETSGFQEAVYDLWHRDYGSGEHLTSIISLEQVVED